MGYRSLMGSAKMHALDRATFMPASRTLLGDLSLPAIAAGFVTVLVGLASSAVIVFKAARHLGADQAEIASWMWALGIGMGVTCIGLSLRYRVPVVTAWSTPGAAMLIGSAAGVPLREAIGAFGGCGIENGGRVFGVVCARDPAHSGFSCLGNVGRSAIALRCGHLRGDAKPGRAGAGDAGHLSMRTALVCATR